MRGRRIFATRMANVVGLCAIPHRLRAEQDPAVRNDDRMMPGHDELAAALRHALLHAIKATSPSMRDPFPTIDCSIALLPPLGKIGSASWAQVLIQAGNSEGLRGDLDPSTATGPHNISYFADPVNDAKDSIAWLPGANWREFKHLEHLSGEGPHRAIAPYPASVIKLMVAVGVCLLIDKNALRWEEMVIVGKERLSISDCCDRMISVSSNEATDALVALLHERGLIDRSSNRNDINNHFQAFGLHGLRFDNSTPQGGWRNPDGAGVGKLQMTSWDCLRLLWLMLDATGEAGVRPPWLSTPQKLDSRPASHIGQYFISESSAKRFWQWMERQALHQVLSSSLLCGLPNWVQGIPARLPKLWINAQGEAQIGPERWPGNFLAQQDLASVSFAHKTGSTWSYAANAGLVSSIKPGGRRYLIAIMSTLGMRHATQERTVTPWLMPALGAEIDAWIAERLG